MQDYPRVSSLSLYTKYICYKVLFVTQFYPEAVV